MSGVCYIVLLTVGILGTEEKRMFLKDVSIVSFSRSLMLCCYFNIMLNMLC